MKLKHIHFSQTIIYKLVIPEGKKDRQSKTPLVKYLVNLVASDSILTKSKADKLQVKNTKQEQQWSTAAGVLTTNTKTSKSFSFPELRATNLMNQSLHVVNLNIYRYDMIIGRDFIRSLGSDIYGADITIHWDDAAIPWRKTGSTTNDVLAISQYNAPFNYENKRINFILNAKYTKAYLLKIAESSTHVEFK